MLPLPVLMTSISPTMGSVATRIGPRIPLTAGPLIVGAGMLLARMIHEDSSYWTGAFPTIAVMAIGMTIAVAPLTSSVLGSVEEQHVAMASGFNSAVARTGGLIATALLGSVLASKGTDLFDGFHLAMYVSAAVAGAAGIVGLTMLGGVRMKNAA
jgi:hypothetical protein